MKPIKRMQNHNRALVVIDDDRLFCDSVRHALKDSGTQVFQAHTGTEGLRICVEKSADVVLLDQKLPDGDGIEFCAPILECNDSAKIIFITAYPSFENAVQAIKVGAHDYLSKPFELGELSLAIDQALRTLDLERLEQVQHYERKQQSSRTVLIGSSPAIQEVEHFVGLAADATSPVLITGETGTGKTMVARAIHYKGRAAEDTFIAVNCAAIPEHLMEAELFGHEKGAFTGAVSTGKGLFEMADRGTLFLDEIGDMPLHLQSKLLGVLDDRQIRRLGSHRFKSVDVRIIAATNADLAEAVKERRFREDLYYRLGVVHIHVPPLRERLEDITELCHHFINRIAPDQQIFIEDDQIAALQKYTWPGNVRELRNVIERAILVRRGPGIQPARLLGQTLFNAGEPQAVQTTDKIQSLQSIEKEHIRRALAFYQGNHTHSAKALGVSRSTLVRKIKVYGL